MIVLPELKKKNKNISNEMWLPIYIVNLTEFRTEKWTSPE